MKSGAVGCCQWRQQNRATSQMQIWSNVLIPFHLLWCAISQPSQAEFEAAEGEKHGRDSERHSSKILLFAKISLMAAGGEILRKNENKIPIPHISL